MSSAPGARSRFGECDGCDGDEHAHANYWVDLDQEERHNPERTAHMDAPSPVDLERSQALIVQAYAEQARKRSEDARKRLAGRR